MFFKEHDCLGLGGVAWFSIFPENPFVMRANSRFLTGKSAGSE
jgi:hypothetical protein